MKLDAGLVKISMPTSVHHSILHGSSDWILPPANGRSHPLNTGSVRGLDMLFYASQVRDIGWYQFILGRISSLWSLVTLAYAPHSSLVTTDQWSTDLIGLLWTFIFSMWTHRNTLVHGAEVAKTAERMLFTLHQEVHQHYLNFQQDPSYVLPQHHDLFSCRSLDQRLTYSYDHLKCWLQSVDEARKVSSFHTHCLQEEATHFFSQTHAQDTSDSSYSLSLSSSNTYSLDETLTVVSSTTASNSNSTPSSSFVSPSIIYTDSSSSSLASFPSSLA